MTTICIFTLSINSILFGKYFSKTLATACDFLKISMPTDRASIDVELSKFRKTGDQMPKEMEPKCYVFNQSISLPAAQRQPKATTQRIIRLQPRQQCIRDLFKKD